jgi:hypothetical protein
MKITAAAEVSFFERLRKIIFCLLHLSGTAMMLDTGAVGSLLFALMR